MAGEEDAVRPMLDALELQQVQEILTYDRRALAEQRPPGMSGSLFQDMGRHPMRLVLWGVTTGAEAAGFLEQLDEKFRAGQPLPFTADIVADAEIASFVIDDLKWQEEAGKPERYAYVLTLREYIEPVEPEEAPLLDGDILDEAQGLIGDMIPGLDIGLDFATGLERFVSPLGDLLKRLAQFNQDIDRARRGG